MKPIKKFNTFLENYSEDVSDMLENEDNNFTVVKGEEVISGCSQLRDCFENISDALETDGAISEEEKYEFMDKVDEEDISFIEQDQYEIDTLLDKLLDIYNVIEPYKIKTREEVEETPLDNGLEDNEEEDGDIFDLSNDFEDDILDYETILQESNSFKIVGTNEEGDEKEIEIIQ